MPYMQDEDRVKWESTLSEFRHTAAIYPRGAPDITYLIFAIAKHGITPKSRFSERCTIMGVLVCVLFEFARRFLNPYEQGKLEANGDVA